MSKKKKKIRHLSFPFGKDLLKLPIPKFLECLGKSPPINGGSILRFIRYNEKKGDEIF
jgi:hypothetical protein